MKENHLYELNLKAGEIEESIEHEHSPYDLENLKEGPYDCITGPG